jgi:hypothetical protein
VFGENRNWCMSVGIYFETYGRFFGWEQVGVLFGMEIYKLCLVAA